MITYRIQCNQEGYDWISSRVQIPPVRFRRRTHQGDVYELFLEDPDDVYTHLMIANWPGVFFVCTHEDTADLPICPMTPDRLDPQPSVARRLEFDTCPEDFIEEILISDDDGVDSEYELPPPGQSELWSSEELLEED